MTTDDQNKVLRNIASNLTNGLTFMGACFLAADVMLFLIFLRAFSFI
jgi:hypothetical protein